MTDRELVDELYKRFTTENSNYYCSNMLEYAEEFYERGCRLTKEDHSHYQLAWALVILRKFVE